MSFTYKPTYPGANLAGAKVSKHNLITSARTSLRGLELLEDFLESLTNWPEVPIRVDISPEETHFSVYFNPIPEGEPEATSLEDMKAIRHACLWAAGPMIRRFSRYDGSFYWKTKKPFVLRGKDGEEFTVSFHLMSMNALSPQCRIVQKQETSTVYEAHCEGSPELDREIGL